MYDLLVNDLRQAIQALETGDIVSRSAALKHAFLVLQQLQGSLDREKGGDAAKNLSNFYAVLRGRIWEAHVKRSSEIFHQQIRLLLDVRQAWAQVDPAHSPAEAVAAPTHPSEPVRTAADDERATTGWTA
jgi:flagellar secretion chaperone FliS